MLKGWFHVKRGKCLNSSSGGFPEFFFCCFSPIPSPPISPPLLSLLSLFLTPNGQSLTTILGYANWEEIYGDLLL